MTDLALLFAFFVAVSATGRLARLIVDDDWPPVMWLREKYVMKVPDAWGELVTCTFCVAPWIALPNLLLGWLSFNGDGQLDWWWWVPNLWLAVAYWAAILNARDVPAD